MRNIALIAVVAAALSGCATTSAFVPATHDDVCAQNGCATEAHPELIEKCIEAQCGPHGAHVVAPDPLQKHDVAEDAPRPPLVAFQAPLEMVHHVPALAGAVAATPAFPFTCTTSAARISPPSGNAGYVGIWIWNGTSTGGANSTPIFIGDANVTTTNGMPLCSGSCPAVDKAYEARGEWCVATTPVAITAQVAQP